MGSAADLTASIRASAAGLPESGIVKVFNHGRTKPGLIPLWAGEGDLPTPRFIAEAATKALIGGETFYTYQRGLPELRASLARYHARLFRREFDAAEFFVTGGGMQAIQLAMQLTVGAGDEVVVPSPAWPNFQGAVETTGASVRFVEMSATPSGWSLDLDRVFAAVSDKTRVIVINSPANPTGWTATREELAELLEFTRRKGLWIIADEIYGRFHFAGGLAPSLQDIRRPGDRILFAQTFSKNWAMTGWRIGWLQAPAGLGQVIENLIQYNTSGVAAFMQRGAIAAVEDGETFVVDQIARAGAGRDIVRRALEPFNTVRLTPPAGAFYQFFAIDGMTQSLDAAIRLVDEANVGLAPGFAFGPGGEGNFRICFLRSPDELEEAMRRLARWLRRRA